MAKKKIKEELDTQKELEQLEAKKRRDLNTLMGKVNTEYGETIVGWLNDPAIADKVNFGFWSSPAIDLNMAVSGNPTDCIPKKKVSILAGNTDSGKTSFLLETIAENMKKDPTFFALWLETEGSLKKDYCVKVFGIDPSRFVFIEHNESSAGERALDILVAFIKSGHFDFAVVNSLKALLPTAEQEKKMENNSIGLQARLNAKFMRVIVPYLNRFGTSLVLVAHLTTNIGGYGDPLVVSGGKAIKFASMLTLRFNKVSVKADPIMDETQGMKINFKIEKNHVCPERYCYLAGSYYVRFGKGIDTIAPLLSTATDLGIIKKGGGGWFSHLDENGEILVWEGTELKIRGQGKMMEFLDEHPTYVEYLKSLVLGDNPSVDDFTTKLTEDEVKELQNDEEQIAEEFAEFSDCLTADEAALKALEESLDSNE